MICHGKIVIVTIIREEDSFRLKLAIASPQKLALTLLRSLQTPF